jgi:exonuclease SbcD
MFRFLHAADIHLDSPLKGLERYEGAPIEEIRGASRRALEGLVRLAIDERVAFVLITGDLYDGDWPDYNTGLFFTRQMGQLREAAIPVFLIAGNHDAKNRMTKALRLPENVTLLSDHKPQTVHLDDCGVAIHGQGYATHAIRNDLSKEYPARVAGAFNIGMLHTCADGADRDHEPYAPCSVEGLRSKEYDYWALGHIHKRRVLHRDPPIVFPGNIQGRHIRETGPKGCSLVSVEGGRPEVEPRRLDVIRWERCAVDACEAEDGYALVDRCAEGLAELVGAADDRPLVVRMDITGPCPAHETVADRAHHWMAEIRARALDDHPGRVWVEKVRLATTRPSRSVAGPDDGPMGELLQYFQELRGDDGPLDPLRASLGDLKKKLAAELGDGPDALDLDGPEAIRAVLDGVEQLLVNRLAVGGRGS